MMNHYSTKISNGDILFNKQSIENMETYKIARKGFFYVDQNPPQLDCQKYKRFDDLFDQISLDKNILSHSVNVGFSDGQKKKNEIIQSALLNSRVLLFDELDTGLDVNAKKRLS